MSRRRQGGAVRGPASALTSFLAGLGVEPSAQMTRSPYERAPDAALAHDGPVLEGDELDPAGAVTARLVEAGPSQVGEGIPEDVDSDALDTDVPPSKRLKRAASIDSDDLDTQERSVPAPTPGPSRGAQVDPQSLKAVGEFMQCGECGKRFTVTAYTKEHPGKSMAWLCVACCYTLGIDPFAKPKKAKAKPGKKEDRAKVVHYEQRKGVSPLGDVCIQLIGKYIEDVDQLGDIGGVNMNKVCRIISKSRRLTPETAALFYSSERTELDMYDCTRLVHTSYMTLAKLCPKLESLRLQLCGQLTTEAVVEWGKTLKKLKRLELFAPFLVRQHGWISFFKAVGKRLEAFMITQSPRIDLDTVQHLVQSCPNIKELRLAEVGQLNSDFVAPLSALPLTHLDLASPGTSLTDDALIELLGKIGTHLVALNLNDHADLTDAALLAVADCPNLKELHLANVVELTDLGVANFFRKLAAKGHPGFAVVNLEKGHELADGALEALLSHSGKTIEKLSLLGWKDVSETALGALSQCKALQELDLGWCRNVTDYTVKDILEGCNDIRVVRVWGCNHLTDAVPRRKGVKVVGIETHTI